MTGTGTTGARILIIDDEEPNLVLLQKLCGHWGYDQLRTLSDPRRAKPVFEEFRPDLILLDLHMPHRDGFQVMADLAPEISPEDYLPILVLTADIATEAKQRALSLGARDFLTKPFDRTEVQLRIANLLETRRLHRATLDQNLILEEKVRVRTLELEQAANETLECLALAAEFRDDDTGEHTKRVGEVAGLLAAEIGLPGDRVDLLRRAAPLHDIGKIGIPDRVLLKPGKLDADEMELVRRHAVIGENILSRHHFPVFTCGAEIALTHHERWDGAGYPRRLKGAEIPIAGRIVAVADVFDALTHRRSYKEAWPVADAAAEIGRQAGSQFDPEVVAAFQRLLALGALPVLLHGNGLSAVPRP